MRTTDRRTPCDRQATPWSGPDRGSSTQLRSPDSHGRPRPRNAPGLPGSQPDRSTVMAVTMSEISVDFRGQGAGTGELTWGQMRVWRTSRQAGLTMNLVMTAPLPEGTSLAEMVALLRFMVSRHPVLRSRLRFTDGPSGSRHPCQVIAETGTVPLQIADIDDEDPAATGEALRARYELTWFDHENEF